MNKFNFLLFALVITSFSFLSCKSDTKKKELSPKSELSHILVYFNNTLPNDGAFDSDKDYDATHEEFSIRPLKDSTIFYCYDTQDLFKIEILGNIYNARIIYLDRSDKETVLLNNEKIEGSYSIVPTAANAYLNGGRLKIFESDSLLKDIKIDYDGCL